MNSENDTPSGAAGGHHPSRAPRSDLKSRHLRAHVVVVVWLALAAAAATTQNSLPVARWLAIHLFLLGAVTTAIVVWTEHFAVALLHARLPDPRWSDARLALVNLGVGGVLTGVWADIPALTGAGCTILVAAIAAHLVTLLRMGRGALGGRLAAVVGFYRAAAVALIGSAVLGWLLATGHAGPHSYERLRSAHIHLAVFGWVALPVLGTLFMLWPTVLGVRMADRTTRVARRVLVLAGGGLLVAVVALAAGRRWPAVAGLAGYAAGIAVALELFARSARSARGRRPVSAAAAWQLGAGAGWLFTVVATDLGHLAADPLPAARDRMTSLVPVLLVGFVAQILIGALTYLLPVVLGRGHEERAALRAVLEWGWPVRIAVLNAGVALAALRVPGPGGTAGMAAAAAAGAVFLALAGTVLLTASGGPARTLLRRPALLGAAAGTAVVLAAVLVAGSGGGTSGGQVLAVGPGSTATAPRTVDVTLADMRIRPGRIEVPKGTDLRLRVTNKDAQRHDLKVGGGPSTPLLAPGQSRTLDLGPVTGDRHAWCTVPGHRAAGMTLDIVVRGDAMAGMQQQSTGQSGATGQDGATGPLDLSGAFAPGWQARPAELAPAPGAVVHRVELHAAERTVEVAPGVRQTMWTFGGTAPGPVLHGRVGDVFEVTLVNDDTAMGHGIDFHAGSLAPDRPMRTIQPGERVVYRFRADHAGAWLYHCSSMPMLQHIGNGMYGAVVIDPPGLPKVDHEYVVVTSELYLGTPGSPAQVAKMRQDTPDAWVFNGVAAQYDKAPLTLRAGQRARFWVVAAGPSDGTAFHIVGTVFDTVYKEGAYLLRPGQSGAGGSQVLDLSVAQGGFVETVFPQPGHYAFVDHDMRKAEDGAHGIVAVTP